MEISVSRVTARTPRATPAKSPHQVTGLKYYPTRPPAAHHFFPPPDKGPLKHHGARYRWDEMVSCGSFAALRVTPHALPLTPTATAYSRDGARLLDASAHGTQ